MCIHIDRCGQETLVFRKLLYLQKDWLSSKIESIRLKEAGITKAILDNALAQLFLQIITNRDVPAPRPCIMDPLTLMSGSYVLDLFPQVSVIACQKYEYEYTKLLDNDLDVQNELPCHLNNKLYKKYVVYDPKEQKRQNDYPTDASIFNEFDINWLNLKIITFPRKIGEIHFHDTRWTSCC